MLSYQHAYHAGNAADVHKHALLAWSLEYLTRKDKPLTYLESHAGRGLYDLAGAEALKTGEAASGIARVEAGFPADHPYLRALGEVRRRFGASRYPGSPLLAAELLRPSDRMLLSERHPQEFAALDRAIGHRAEVFAGDGYAKVRAQVPPEPRRGLLLVDPSYEMDSDYADMPEFLGRVARVWNVGILCLWYPLLQAPRHLAMIASLIARFPGALVSEALFPPAREGHRMVGSGLFVIRPPWGLEEEARRVEALLAG